jgi:hypothetical protein
MNMKVCVVMEFYVAVSSQDEADGLAKLRAVDLVKFAHGRGETFNIDISEASEEYSTSQARRREY